MLVVRHFFYDWEHEVPVTMSIEPLSGPTGHRRALAGGAEGGNGPSGDRSG